MTSRAAATAAAVLSPMKPAAREESKQQHAFAPAATAPRVSFSATQPLSSPGAAAAAAPAKPTYSDFLTSSFQIGSAHGRMHFAPSERVFHRSDVPPRAREAVEAVTAFLRTEVLNPSAAPWDASTTSGVAIRGSKHCSWETEAQRFDDRFYHRVESSHRVAQAKARIEAIRAGVDPDADPRHVNPRWNVSSFIEEKPVVPLSVIKGDGASAPPREVKHLPADYQSLVRKQHHLSMYRRASKEAEAAAKAEQDALEASWAAWARQAHVQGRPVEPQLDRSFVPDHARVAQQVEQQYSQEKLAHFLWQQEHPEEAAAAGLPPLQNPAQAVAAARPLNAHELAMARHAARPSVHQQHHHPNPLADSNYPAPHQGKLDASASPLPYSSVIPPAWYRLEARTKQVASAKAMAPYAKFQHPGEYEWVPSSPGEDELSRGEGEDGAAPILPGLAGSEAHVAGGFYRWSCCLHPLRDARGCQAVDVDTKKRRMVVARSDDPHSSAAWGLGSASMGGAARAGVGAGAGLARGVGDGSLDASHVRARSGQAVAALSASLRASPMSGGTSGVAPRASSSGMGASGPGVAAVLRLEHTGRFEEHKVSGERMWSCCGSSDATGPGCVAKTVTREARWQLESS